VLFITSMPSAAYLCVSRLSQWQLRPWVSVFWDMMPCSLIGRQTNMWKITNMYQDFFSLSLNKNTFQKQLKH